MTNPLLAPWDGPFGLPPFADVRAEQFAPAFAERLRDSDALLESAEVHGNFYGTPREPAEAAALPRTFRKRRASKFSPT